MDVRMEILALCAELELVRDDLFVWFDYSGHVQGLRIMVARKEDATFEEGTKTVYILNESFYLDFRYGTDKAYKKIKSFLKSEIEKVS